MRNISRIAACLALLAATARADDAITNVMSPIVSYLTVDVNTNIMSLPASYQFQDDIGSELLASGGVQSLPASYLFLDYLGDANVTFHAAPTVSYFWQPQYGTGATFFVMSGTVTDPTGAAILGATVKASVSQSVVAQTTADSGGHYALPAVAAGVYVLQVSEPSHASAARALTLNANTAQQNFQLAILPAAPAVVQTNRQPSSAYTPSPPGPMGSILRVFDGSEFVPITAGNQPAANLMTIVMTHGWVPGTPNSSIMNTLFHDEFPTNTAALMLASGITPAKANILAWDWRYAAEGVLPPEEHTPEQGVALGQALTNVLGAHYSQKLHFIGHSLGTMVNAAAANYLHGDRTAQQAVSLTPWNPANTYMTLFDQAELSRMVGSEVLFDGLVTMAEGGLDDPVVVLHLAAQTLQGWKPSTPMQSEWADNYISLVGFYLPNTENIALEKAQGIAAARAAAESSDPLTRTIKTLEYAHGYPMDWYGASIANPGDSANPLGFKQSITYAQSFGTTPPSDNNFPLGDAYHQTPSSGDQLALEPLPDADIFQAIVPLFGNGADKIIQGVVGTVQAVNNVAVDIKNEAVAAGQAIDQGFNTAVNATQQGVNSVVNIYNAGVLHLRVVTGISFLGAQPHQAGSLQILDAGNPTNSAAMAWLPIQIPSNTVAMAFDFIVSGNPVDDVMVCGIGDTNLFSLAAKYIPTNTISASRLIDVSQWSGQPVELFFGLMGGTSTNASLEIENIRFYSLQPPQLNMFVNGSTATLSWPSNVGGGVVEGAASLFSTNWEAITNAPVLSPTSYMVTNSLTDPIRFFRLRSQ